MPKCLISSNFTWITENTENSNKNRHQKLTIWNAWWKLWERFPSQIQYVEQPLMFDDQWMLKQEEKQELMLSGKSQIDGWCHLKAS